MTATTVTEALEVLAVRKRTLAESLDSLRINRSQVQYLLIGLDVKAEEILDNASTYSAGVLQFCEQHLPNQEIDVQDLIASAFMDGLITGCIINKA